MFSNLRAAVAVAMGGSVCAVSGALAFTGTFGTTDTSFGSNTTPGYAVTSGINYGIGLATGSDNSIYALGVNCPLAATGGTCTPGGFPGWYVPFATHYLASGVPDLTFGNAGVLPVPSFGAETANIAADDVHGLLYIGGFTCATKDGQNCRFQVVRIRMDGTTDTSYGNNGFSDFMPTKGIEDNDPGLKTPQQTVSSVVLDSALNLYIYGLDAGPESTAAGAPFVPQVSYIARLTSAGKLDPTFNASGANPGYLSFPFGSCDAPSEVSLGAGGVIYLSSRSCNAAISAQPAPALARVLATGVLDTTFGTNGIATYPTLGNYFGTFQQEQPDGSISFAFGTDQVHFFLAMLNHDGSRNASVPVTPAPYTPSSAAFNPLGGNTFQSDGRLLITGMWWPDTTKPNAQGVTRIDGDPSFSYTLPNFGTPDRTPTAFSFTPATGATPSAAVSSNVVTPAGYNAPAAVSITGGGYSVNGGTFTTAPGTIYPGEPLQVQVTAPAAGQTTAATVTVGGASAKFSVTSAGDATPDVFSFTAVAGATPGATISSNVVTPTGYNIPAPLAVTGGMYSVAGGTFTAAPGSISPGQTLQLQAVAGAPGHTATATVTVGGTSATFSVASVPVDTSPDAFSFTPISGAAPGALVTSNLVTPTGYNSAAPVTVTGGSYSIDGGAFTEGAGSIAPGQTLQLRTTAPAAGQTVSETVNIGGTSGTFEVSSANQGGGSSGGGGGAITPLPLLLLFLTAAIRFRSGRRPTQPR